MAVFGNRLILAVWSGLVHRADGVDGAYVRSMSTNEPLLWLVGTPVPGRESTDHRTGGAGAGRGFHQALRAGPIT